LCRRHRNPRPRCRRNPAAPRRHTTVRPTRWPARYASRSRRIPWVHTSSVPLVRRNSPMATRRSLLPGRIRRRQGPGGQSARWRRRGRRPLHQRREQGCCVYDRSPGRSDRRLRPHVPWRHIHWPDDDPGRNRQGNYPKRRSHLHDQHTGDPVAAGDRATAARSTRTDTIAKSLWGSGTPPLFATPRGHDSTSAQAPSSKIDNP
jgi:hypothetical protein